MLTWSKEKRQEDVNLVENWGRQEELLCQSVRPQRKEEEERREEKGISVLQHNN
jgi:hypothetical protein